MKDNRIGIIGFGTMGQGLAQWFIHKGYQVFIKTERRESVEDFIASIERYYLRKVKRGVMGISEFSERIKQIHYLKDFEELKKLDVIIEAVKEDLEIKRQIISQIRGIAPEQTLLATTTSSFSITELSEGLEDCSNFIGLHFFNPVSIMDMVEVIPGKATDSKTLNNAIEFCKKIGKTPIVVNDGRGFLVNRIFARFMNEASRMLECGAGSVQEIDLELSNNLMPNGPYYIADFIGLDVLLKINENLNEYYKGNKFRTCLSLKMLCEKGRLGRKVGRGYYSYIGQGIDKEMDKELIEIIRFIKGNSLIEPLPLSREIALFSMISEAFHCLEEGVIIQAADIDLALKYGLGMFKGPIEVACQIGPKAVYERLRDMAKQFGERFNPPPLLKRFEV
ncbi:MAG: NAD(P)-binding domain-containing protein [Nitrospinae bacterium]|nr:NAD(P)-binding domain-containing protein [Nitrospinota bacterium]MBI3815340.1 NAD(P)-binding domain-containing protein [Nitrospinota bacterium]